MDKTPTRLRFITWYDTPAEQRNPYTMKGFAGENHVNLTTLYSWEKQIKTARGEVKDGYDPIKHLGGELKRIVENLLKSCGTGNAQSLKLAFQLLDLLKEKTEVDLKIGLSAEEHLRIREEAVRRVQELNSRATDRDRSLSEESPVLLEDIRED